MLLWKPSQVLLILKALSTKVRTKLNYNVNYNVAPVVATMNLYNVQK